MNNILEVRSLNKSYGNFSLADVSFDIPKGYIMGFIGPNGAGKTTTIKSILNMINYQSGEIKLFGQDSKADLMNEQIGVVTDSPLYVDDWTMADVEAAVSLFYRKWDSKTYAELLQKFGIEKKKKVKELSRGMKVKLMIAVALSHEAKLLILDEPTSGLDPVTRDELCSMLSDFVTDEKSILFSTHITEDLEKIADYITFILNGRIVYSGPKEDLLEKYVLVKGGLSDITSDQKKMIMGLREHSTGFDGMTESANIGKFKNLLIEPITLDEIIIYMSKEGELYE
ncbi:MAG: ABC transporter ATP-binding protein [Methanimicrococcus sp.]|nr:ABC transporter ATP-binding protein [Methanimicrococcus sp.]